MRTSAFWAHALALVLGSGCGHEPSGAPAPSNAPEGVAARRFATEPIQALSMPDERAPELVELGARLFFEARLSRDASISCASCHDLDQGGDDGRALPLGIDQRQGHLNTLSVLNAALNTAYFWDGRAQSLEAQVEGPIGAADEMASNWPDIVGRLSRGPSYARQFAVCFEQGITADTVKRALSAFERRLITTGSRFDRWLEGDTSALTPLELEGYAVFKSVGCTACHQGRNLGGNMFERLGVMGDYFAERGNVTAADNGRFNVTHDEDDRHVFRVPTLRNVELTAPYFHDGSTPTLQQAVRVMARFQLGRQLSEGQITTVVAFLKTLTAPLPADVRSLIDRARAPTAGLESQ